MDDINNGMISYDNALEIAKENGKTYVIHLLNTGYEIEDLY